MRKALAVLALVALGVMVVERVRAQTVEASLATAFDRAQRDFDATRAELALGGSAPLPGLEPVRSKPIGHRGKTAAPARTAAAKPQPPAKAR
jgi:hypothetical protein